MTKITKGTRVYYISRWDDKGTVLVRTFTVDSWGKRQGTLLETDGTNAKFRVYTQRDHLRHAVTVAVADTPDIEAFALGLAAEWLAQERDRLEQCLERGKNDPCYTAAVMKDVEALHEPRVIYR